MRRNILKSREKARRLLANHPRNLALTQAVPHRNTRRSWARLGSDLEALLPPEAEDRNPIPVALVPPWQPSHKTLVFPDLDGIASEADDPVIIRTAAEAAIAKWNSDLTIFTDGSAVGGRLQGGAAAVVQIHDDPPRFESILSKGAAFTSSFEEECAAMDLAIEWIVNNCIP